MLVIIVYVSIVTNAIYIECRGVIDLNLIIKYFSNLANKNYRITFKYNYYSFCCY